MAILSPKVIPHLWFDTKAKEAAEYYVKVFRENPSETEIENSKIISHTVLRDSPSGDCDVMEFMLAGQRFMSISAGPLFEFTEAVSFIVACSSQEEIDYFWGKLSAVPEAEQCGWCKDKYGLSWQIWSLELGEMMKSDDRQRLSQMQTELWKMEKLEIAKLKMAFAK